MAPNVVSPQVPTDIGEVTRNARSMWKNRAGRPRSRIEQNRARQQRRERDVRSGPGQRRGRCAAIQSRECGDYG